MTPGTASSSTRSTREKDLAWIREQAEAFEVDVVERSELAMIAVQGPNASELAAPCIDAQYRDAALALKPFFGMEAGDWFVARTGYTGEDGWEIVMPAAERSGCLGSVAGGWCRAVRTGCQGYAAP